MNIKYESGCVLIISRRLTYFFGIFSGSPKTIRAATFFPFILFVRSEAEIVPWLMNHEKIHFRQQLELAIIGSILLHIFETIYALLILRKTLKEAYLWHSAEQEAYRHQNDEAYLNRRPFWAQFKYLKDKKEFIVSGPGEITFTAK